MLLPLGDEYGVGVAVLEQPVVQGAADGLLLVVELVDVAGALVGDLEDGPLRLVLRHVRRRRVLRVLHLDPEHLEVVPDVVEARRRLLAPRGVGADCGHFFIEFVLSCLALFCFVVFWVFFSGVAIIEAAEIWMVGNVSS